MYNPFSSTLVIAFVSLLGVGGLSILSILSVRSGCGAGQGWGFSGPPRATADLSPVAFSQCRR